MSSSIRFKRGMEWTLLIMICWGPASSYAVDWKRMVMPGPLVEGHKGLEENCADCHVAFDDEVQRSLCLACHKNVADDVQRKEGFHSRNTLASRGQCRSCHSDHMGRDADIRGLSEATFDHGQTDYPLSGRHERVACLECHLPEIPRRDAPSDCVSCHREDDVHRGSLSEDCSQCHSEKSWNTSRFDHDSTKYRLTGSHKTADCVGCHVAEQYKGTPESCNSCHSIDDVHAGGFGSACADCHDTKSWRRENFDHKKKSGFPLLGAHAESACVTCHREPPGKRKLPEDCSGCHASEDVHAGNFGTQCSTCHSPSAWNKASFDHAKKTKFPLKDAHAIASCSDCHAGPLDTGKTLETDCLSCHQSDDVHQGKLGKNCSDCHDEISFLGRIQFDHDLASFPLLGLHAITACESCHRDQTFQRDDQSCRSCHVSEDVHRESLGKDCARCHNPNGWSIWRFDHNAESEFGLHGSHEGAECSACHRTPMNGRVRPPANCVDCHVSEDAHRGGFGRRCGDCHGEVAWKPASFGRGGQRGGSKK